MNQLLSKEKLQQDLEKDGYTVIEFLDAQEIQTLTSLYYSLPNTLEGGFAPSIMSKDINYRQLINREIKQILNDKTIKLFKQYRLCFWSFIVKQALRTDSEVQMHQDWSFVDETKFNSLGIWCPLVDVNYLNGCIHLVKGSHQLNTKPRGLFNDFPYENILSVIWEKYLTKIPIQAGQALVYDTRIFHCSPPNQTANERVVVAGLMIPKNSILRYYHCDFQNDSSKLEIFEVDDEFYTRIILGVKPEGLRSLGFIDREFEPLTPENLASQLSNEVI
ncbi:hypothetical protein B4U84_18890 [Westiellopsis prolifica IICB1]|nr:hypothetical protein B4U84_18890 [Westiellopsis prolifica IICB1]